MDHYKKKNSGEFKTKSGTTKTLYGLVEVNTEVDV